MGNLRKKRRNFSILEKKKISFNTNEWKLYTDERIEDIYSKRNLDEDNEEIRELLEKNCNLQEEFRNLKREQEIQSVRLCEVMEEKDKAKEEIEEKNNEI